MPHFPRGKTDPINAGLCRVHVMMGSCVVCTKKRVLAIMGAHSPMVATRGQGIGSDSARWAGGDRTEGLMTKVSYPYRIGSVKERP